MGSANFPMALDESNHRFFVACRKPVALLVFDTDSRKVVARVDSPGDANDLWYDAAWKRLYISGGEGFIGVIEQHDGDHYTALAKVPSAAGARTSLFSQDLLRLFLAVPLRDDQKAELRIYYVAP